MKIPKTPPEFNTVWKKVEANKDRLAQLLFLLSDSTVNGKYLHWDKLLYHKTPKDVTHEEWWFALKLQRRNLYKQLPLFDKQNRSFLHLNVDPINEILHEIDQSAGGSIQMPEQITNPDTRDQYYVSSLIQEAITSSQLEGAATTRQIAKEMIKTGRAPQDESEQMILNNFKTMQRIGRLKDEQLSPELVFEIHQLITHNTLNNLSDAGRFRNDSERIVVGDIYGEVFHEPPPAEQLELRLGAMCEFANGLGPTGFIHPVIRAIILHFWLAYDHPFVDGNGRTARALFYWSMLRSNYWLFEYISISQIILKAPTKYGRAFLYTETDDNDLTYFILYHLDVIQKAVRELHQYIKYKTHRLQVLEQQLQGITLLNHRQRALISHALRHPLHKYTFESHRICHNVVYETSRRDFLDLQDRGLLVGGKIGKTWYFTPIKDLEKRLARLPE